MLVKTLAAEDKYHILNREMLTVTIQMKLSQKPKAFSEFFPPFFKYRLILNIWKEEMTLIDFLFPKLRTRKMPLDKCPKKPVLGASLTSSMVNGLKKC